MVPMNQKGFGALELIGTLAILVILTCLLLPRITRIAGKPEVLQTINEAHLTQAASAIQSLQTAITQHLAQFGSLASLNGTALKVDDTYDKFSQVLLSEGFIERPFELRLGTNAFLRLVRSSGLTAATPVSGSNGAYDLSGAGRNAVTSAAFVLEAVIPEVNEAEARALNDRIDGAGLGTSGGNEDLRGRVIYQTPGPSGRTEVHIYLAQK